MRTQYLPWIVAAAFGFIACFALNVNASDESDRAALRLIRTNYMEAVNSNDLSKIAPFLSKEVTGVMVTGEEVKGIEGLKSYWNYVQNLVGPGGKYNVTVNVDKTDLYGDVAVARGKTDDLIRLGVGKELRFNSYWTAVCHKEEGIWKVIRMEATMNPVENVFVALKIRKAELVFGIGGIVIGAILMLAVKFARRRKEKSIGG